MTVYDSLADVYEWFTPEWLLTPEGNVAAFADWLPPAPARVLDCACGIGLLAAGLAAAGYDAHASDLSPEMVARARENGALFARVCAWDDLPPSGDFDAVACVGNSLPHTPDRVRALRAMAGALRPGGTLIVTSRNWEKELAAGTRMEVDDRLTERRGQRALVSRAWTFGEHVQLETAVSFIDETPVRTVSEAFELWPFTHEQLRADLGAAGLVPVKSTYDPDVPRYVVMARR